MPDQNAPSIPDMPNRAGVGYKAQHLDGILKDPSAIGWIEIHAENYMGDGGRPIAQLKHLREIYPVSCHGVGLSIGAEGPLDTDHLARLKHLVIDHIDQVQDTVGRRMLLENPSTYCAFDESDMSEIDFLSEVATRSGCGLLLDVNNVFISATNQQYSPQAYIDAYPLQHVGEIHLGGHEEDADDHGEVLLIDSHSRQVVDPVWELYKYTLKQSGPRPTLIEWDNDIPSWDVLANEARLADDLLSNAQLMAAQ